MAEKIQKRICRLRSIIYIIKDERLTWKASWLTRYSQSQERMNQISKEHGNPDGKRGQTSQLPITKNLFYWGRVDHKSKEQRLEKTYYEFVRESNRHTPINHHYDDEKGCQIHAQTWNMPLPHSPFQLEKWKKQKGGRHWAV